MAKIVLYYSPVQQEDISLYSGLPQSYQPQGDVAGQIIEGNEILKFKDFDTASIIDIGKKNKYKVGFTLIRHDDIVYPIVTTLNDKIITPYTTSDYLELIPIKGEKAITIIPASLYSTLNFSKYKINLYNK